MQKGSKCHKKKEGHRTFSAFTPQIVVLKFEKWEFFVHITLIYLNDYQ